MQLSEKNKLIKILDIGPSYQTEIMRLTLLNCKVDSLGFPNIYFKPHSNNRHIQYDLNNTQNKKRWPEIGKYHIIVMAEVIEHLHTSPSLVLGCISNWLEKDGYLIIQTPNALALKKRFKLMFGKNPQEMIREDILNPGHFREYTAQELISIGRKVNLEYYTYIADNYFRHRFRFEKIYDFLCKILPKNFRDGITIIFQK